jgi:hypothetical protein
MPYACTDCIYYSPDDPTAEFCLQERNPAVIEFCQSEPYDNADMSECPGFLLSFVLPDEYVSDLSFDVECI